MDVLRDVAGIKFCKDTFLFKVTVGESVRYAVSEEQAKMVLVLMDKGILK